MLLLGALRVWIFYFVLMEILSPPEGHHKHNCASTRLNFKLFIINTCMETHTVLKHKGPLHTMCFLHKFWFFWVFTPFTHYLPWLHQTRVTIEKMMQKSKKMMRKPKNMHSVQQAIAAKHRNKKSILTHFQTYIKLIF